jgi:protocatechuate 3,4-dioxygenase beta subunit
LAVDEMKKDRIDRIAVASMLNRREVLGFIGGTAAVSLVGGLRRLSASAAPMGMSIQAPTQMAIATPSCVVRPQQTEGPYFVDEKLNRSDIRLDPSDGRMRLGVPLYLAFHVSQINGSSCTPLNGATVDIWHCDALGNYSDVMNLDNVSTVGKKFLRGYQVTDANGTAKFVTIYPGWYMGRTVHIHFKIRTTSASQRNYQFTSQLYFDDTITDQIHAQRPYAAHGQRTLKNNQDGIFRNGGKELMLQLTKEGRGYVGAFDIGLQMNGT